MELIHRSVMNVLKIAFVRMHELYVVQCFLCVHINFQWADTVEAQKKSLTFSCR
jgi:hypothetical protein